MQAGRWTMTAAALVGFLVSPAQGQVRGDFNGDGFSDLAIGVPNESVGTIHGAGAVNVIYGSPGGGLQTNGDQFWHQDSPGVIGGAEVDDGFGFALASGDFDGDGYSDLAVGAVGEGIGPHAAAGAVHVIYGSPGGLTATDNQLFHQNVPDVEDAVEAGDNFGFALAAGDFNADGYDELVIGIPGEGVEGLVPRFDGRGLLQFDDFGVAIFDTSEQSRAGAVAVLFGSIDGITTDGDQIFHQQTQFLGIGSRVTGIGGGAWPGDEFGAALAVGDYNGDGVEDLAVGARGEGFESYVINNVLVTVENVLPVDAGVAHVLFSDWSGLTVVGSQILHQNVLDTQAIAETGDRFGSSLAAGDFNGDTFDDLAVGVAFETVARLPQPGAVHVIYGFHEGLIVEGNKLFHQDIDGIQGRADADDRFGSSVAACDFDGDGFDDVAIGVPHDTIFGVLGAGAVNVLYGARAGLLVERDQYWHQALAFTPERPERWDQFGHSLAVGDFDGDGLCDLAVGVFNEPVGLINGAGVVTAIYGQAGTGLATAGIQLWKQANPAILGGAEPVDWFGFAVASGN